MEMSDIILYEDKQGNFRDEKGREVIVYGKAGKIAISRYPDLSHDQKELMAKIYSQEDAGEKFDNVIKFLNFETDEFCS